jgi:hypothetical protein
MLFEKLSLSFEPVFDSVPVLAASLDVEVVSPQLDFFSGRKICHGRFSSGWNESSLLGIRVVAFGYDICVVESCRSAGYNFG